MKSLPIQIGLAVVIGSHLWMLQIDKPPAMEKPSNHHAIMNLGAAAMIIYGLY